MIIVVKLFFFMIIHILKVERLILTDSNKSIGSPRSSPEHIHNEIPHEVFIEAMAFATPPVFEMIGTSRRGINGLCAFGRPVDVCN